MSALLEQVIYSVRETIAEELRQVDVSDAEQLHDAIDRIARDVVSQILKPIEV